MKFKLNEFKEFLYSGNYDIAGISETKTDINYKIKIPGYKVYLKSRNNQGGGVAVAVKNNIRHDLLNFFNLKNIEAIGITLNSGSKRLCVVQTYLPPNVNLSVDDLKNLFSFSNIIVMGDLNCKRKEWNCTTDNVNGKTLLDYCLSNKIVISAPLNFTNIPTRGSASVIDIFLFKSNINHSLPESLYELSSDHNPVKVSISYNYDKVFKIESYDYSKADWINVKKYLNDRLDLNFHITTTTELEQKCKLFIEMIQEAIKNNIPLKKSNPYLVKIPNSLKNLIKIKNKARKNAQSFPSPFLKRLASNLGRLVNCELRKVYSKNLEKYLKKLNPNDGSFWKYAKRLKNKIETLPDIEHNNEIWTRDIDKANGFAEHFASISKSCLNLGNKTFTNKVQRNVNKMLNTPINLDEIKFANFSEVEKAIKSLKNGKATGSDKIGAKIIKSLPRKAIVFLLKIINSIFCTGYFPEIWKLAKVIPVPKKNRDLNKVSGYRPISLLPHISKVVEKVIKNRILNFLQEQQILVNEQFGFRHGHSTVDQLARLVNDITVNFNNKKHTGALLLDIADAFPTMWIEGFIQKIIDYKFPLYLIRLLYSYLTKRKMFVELNGEISSNCSLMSGVPQGSVLGPILFIVFINDAPKIRGVDVSLFADDKLLYTMSYKVSAIVKRLQLAYDRHKRYFHRWKIKLNEAKTEAIIFTKRRPKISSFVKINNVNLEWKDNVKYLGVILDCRLNFNAHVNSIVCKSINSLIRLYPIFSRNSFVSTENKILLYKVNIRTAMTYACPVWSYVSKTSFNKLQITQNKFLRIIGNFRRYTMIKEIHDKLNIDFLHEYVKKLSTAYYNRISTHVNALVQNVLYENKRYKHKRIMNIIYD